MYTVHRTIAILIISLTGTMISCQCCKKSKVVASPNYTWSKDSISKHRMREDYPSNVDFNKELFYKTNPLEKSLIPSTHAKQQFIVDYPSVFEVSWIKEVITARSDQESDTVQFIAVFSLNKRINRVTYSMLGTSSEFKVR